MSRLNVVVETERPDLTDGRVAGPDDDHVLMPTGETAVLLDSDTEGDPYFMEAGTYRTLPTPDGFDPVTRTINPERWWTNAPEVDDLFGRVYESRPRQPRDVLSADEAELMDELFPRQPGEGTWGSHPDHAAAVEQIGRGLPYPPSLGSLGLLNVPQRTDGTWGSAEVIDGFNLRRGTTQRERLLMTATQARTTAEEMAVQVLRGNMQAARGLADYLCEHVYADGGQEVKPAPVVVPVGDVKVLVYFDDENEMYDAVGVEAAVREWLTDPTRHSLGLVGVRKVEIYSFPKE